MSSFIQLSTKTLSFVTKQTSLYLQMPILLPSLHKLYNLKTHEKSRTSSACLHAFQSRISSYINKFAPDSKPELGTLSFKRIQQCLQLLPMINKAFAKLVVDLDYPANKWETKSIEEYLNYNLHLLDYLNSIISSLSHLGHARLALSHALSVTEKSPATGISHLKSIRFESSCNYKETEVNSERNPTSVSVKERVVNHALKEMKSIASWVYSTVLSALSGNKKPNLTKLDSLVLNPLLINLDMSVRGCVIKEVKELKDGVGGVESALENGKMSDTMKDMKRKVEEFEKLVDGLREQVEELFSQALASRSELLGSIRHRSTEHK